MVLLLSLMRSERCSTKYLARGADTASRNSLALKNVQFIMKSHKLKISVFTN